MRQSSGPATSSERIHIAAAVVTNREGRILLVRKRNAVFFMQPGGKLEEGETELETLARELNEELGCILVKAELLGIFSAPAANEPAHAVEAALFHADIDGRDKTRSRNRRGSLNRAASDVRSPASPFNARPRIAARHDAPVATILGVIVASTGHTT
jgi:8-oxo-dGTP diphosphatase